MTSWRSAWRSLRKAAGLPHVRFHDGRHALDEAAKALEPDVRPTVPTPPDPPVSAPMVMSHVTSQQGSSRSKVIDFPKETGAPSRTRTCDLLVRSLMQVFGLVGSSCA
jgi:hypothetical protein